METYSEMDVNIYEIRQSTWVVNQAWKLIYKSVT